MPVFVMSLLGILMREREREMGSKIPVLCSSSIQFTNWGMGLWPTKNAQVSVRSCTRFILIHYSAKSGVAVIHACMYTFARTGVFRVRRSPAPELLNLAKTTIKRQLKDYFNRNWVHINLLIIKSLNASDKRKGGMSKEKISHGDTFLSMFALT